MQFKLENSLANYIKLILFFTLIGFFYRGLFLVYHWSQFEQLAFSQINTALFSGIRFDLSIASYFATFYSLGSLIVFKSIRFKQVSFALWFLFFSGLLVSDIMYFTESARHLGYELTEATHSGLEVLAMAWVQHTSLMIFNSLFQLAVCYFIIKKVSFTSSFPKIGFRNFGNLLLNLIILVVLSRGGIQMIPIKPEFAYQLGNSKLAIIALNGAYSALFETFNNRSLKQMQLPFERSKSTPQIKALYARPSEYKSPSLKKPNIVFFLLEGWSLKHLSSYYGPENNSPNFDFFKSRGLSADIMFAEGHRTTEGTFSIFCSFPNPLGKSVAQSQLQHADYNCLPKILKQYGYSTSFIQGSLKETSGTGSFAQSLGFDQSFGRMDIPNEKWGLNYWGKHDGDIYDFAFEKAEQLKEPFAIAINTNSTHDTVMPENWQPIHLPADKHPRKNLIHYADQMLGEFIRKMEKKYPDTIFVISSDHTSYVQGNIFEEYAIPFVIYGKSIPSKHIKGFISHRDIAPTVSGILNIPPKKFEHFTGNNLLESQSSFAVIYHQGSFGFANADRFHQLNYLDGKARWKHFQWKPSTKNLVLDENFDFSLKQSFFDFISYTQDLLFKGKTTKFTKSPETFDTHIEKIKETLQ